MNPNIVIIVADALRRDKVGVYGGKDITPNIDKFAEEACVFTNAFTVSNATDPAVTSINTGQYPLNHGVVNHGFRVTEKEKRKVESSSWLPEVLSKNGYKTAKFGRPLGRWHRRGFDIYPSVKEDRRAFDDKGQIIRRKIKCAVKSVSKKIPGALGMLKRAHNFIKKKESSDYENKEDKVIKNFKNFLDKNEGHFFSFIHLMDTHSTYNGSPHLVKKYLEKFDYNVDNAGDISGKIPNEFHKLVLNDKFSEIYEKYYFSEGKPSTAVVDAHYDASVTRTDERIGRILDCLKANEVFDNTFIVVLSDHGESLTEHGIYYDHHGLYDSTVRVPLIIRFPDDKNGDIDDLVQITDITPTIMDITNLDDESDLGSDGTSLLSIIEEGKSLDREFVFAEEAHTQRRRMVRSKDKKK